jgi:ATP-dependent DNA helicase RecG
VGDKFTEQLFTGPINDQLRSALRYIKNNFIRERVVKIEGKAEARRYFNYPYEAVEEALANAVYHRSYEALNPIEVNLRHDRIEIISFPGPMPPVNNEDLKKEIVIVRDYRNRRIGDFLKELELTEGRSTGFPKIRRKLKQNGSPEPLFQTDEQLSYFLTVLYPHPDFTGQKEHLRGPSRIKKRNTAENAEKAEFYWRINNNGLRSAQRIDGIHKGRLARGIYSKK